MPSSLSPNLAVSASLLATVLLVQSPIPTLCDGEEEKPVNYTDPCLKNPCKNYGGCDRIGPTKEQFRCSCVCNFFGENCEIPKVKHCVSNKDCQNNGTCENRFYDKAGQYRNETCTWKTCMCREGYIGDFCENDWTRCYTAGEKGVDNHKQKWCFGNGFCENSTGNVYGECQCKSGSFGPQCESRPNPSDVASQTKSWFFTFVLIIGIVAAAVVVERVWNFGRKRLNCMLGREGFRRVFLGEDSSSENAVGNEQKIEEKESEARDATGKNELACETKSAQSATDDPI